MPSFQLSTELLIALLSAIGAVISAFYAWRSARIANEALELTRRDHVERHTGLSAYLIDGVAWDDQGGERLVAFACSVSNTASAPLSVIRIDLHLHSVLGDGSTTQLVLTPEAAGTPSIWDLKPLTAPLNLDARTTASGWLGYRIPQRVGQAMTIDKYEIVFLTSTGDRTSVEQYLLQRVVNATRPT